jgi:hypothetical protein
MLPAGVLAAALIGTACGPPQPPTPPPPPPPACGAVPASGVAGPDTQNPIPGAWGVDGRALASVVIGNRVYVGGTFNNAVSPTGALVARNKLAAFCLADGKLDTSFVPNIGATAITSVNALATDGTNLFVGGNFMAGASPLHLVKVSTTGARIAAFAPKAPQAPVLDMHFANGVLYAGGEFGKLGAPPAGNQIYVGNAAGFNPTTGAWNGWFAGTNSKVEAITVSPDNTAVYIGGNFTEVKKPSQQVAGTARDRLARLQTAAPGNLVAAFNAGVLGARPYDLAVSANNASLYAAIGTGPGAAGAGNRIINFNAADGTQAWNNNNLRGNGEAVEVIGANLFAGFLGGYDNPSAPLPLNPSNYRLLGINPANGINTQITAFQPQVVSASPDNGVFDLTQGSNRMVAVGDFTVIGTTTNLRGLAIFG